jgi:NAD(P)H-hydrate epimerase
MSRLSKQEAATKTVDRSVVRFVLDRDSVRAVDRAAVDEFGIPSIVLMENAARGLATEALRMLEGAPTPRATIVCGSGNNGGDGYALARHLHNAEIDTSIVSLGEPKAGSDAATNCRICRAIGIR